MQNWLHQSRYGKQFNMADYGYTEEMLASQAFRKSLYSIIAKEMKKNIDDYSNGRPLTSDIIIPVNNGKTYTISNFQIIDEIKKSIKMISSVDDNFARKVKDRIRENSKQEGIDSSNYCFDQKKTKPTSINKKTVILQQQESIKELAKQYGCFFIN